MKIQVFPNMKISEIQEAFSRFFPYLSLSFFTQPHDVYQFSPVKYMITERDIVLSRIEVSPHSAIIDIVADMTASDVEHLFEQEFGLHVQVMRKHGDVWIETTSSDSQSLLKQNDYAAQVSANRIPCTDQMDFLNVRTEWFLG